MEKLLVSLFDYSGMWSLFFEQTGYRVLRVDTKLGEDVMTWKPPRCRVEGVLAAPPCTHFSVSGSQYWAEKDEDGRTREGVALVMRTLTLVDRMQPRFWMLENPVGRLYNWIGRPSLYFDPCDYAGYSPCPDEDRYTKKTCLWGKFRMPEKRRLEPVMYERGGKRGSWMWANLGGKSERTKELRSETPLGFARATWLGNRR